MSQIKNVNKTELNHFQKLIGRKFAINFVDAKDMYKYNLSRHDSKVCYFEGICENFSTRSCAFYDEKYGFNIVDYSMIVSMIDITP